jgi:ADP-heptose:LPS heptosyltransferase
MRCLRAQRIVFAGTSRLTDRFPVAGGRLLDALILPVLGSRALAAWSARRNRRVMERVRAFRRFLVIPDIHIGDAVMTETSLAALADFFPDAEIDYVVNRRVAPLIEGHPDASRITPIFSSAQFPTPADIAALRDVIRTGHYDLCLNFGTFLKLRDVVGRGQPFVSFLSHAATLLHNERDPGAINHFSYQHHQFVRNVLSMVARPVRTPEYRGVRTTFSDEAIERAARFAAEAGLSSGAPVIMINPDGACRFTLTPFATQAELVGRLAADTAAETRILLGAGHTFEGVGQRLLESVPAPLRAKLRIIPRSMPLEVYAAVMDYADVFITGDTGPLHLAAARRYSRSGRHRFRNRTAVLSLFGATASRMSGYDSVRAGYLAADQSAPSWCYVADSPCRNITCLNKYFKTCAAVRCFERTDVAALARLVADHVGALSGQAPARQGGPPSDPAPVGREFPTMR